MLANSAGVEFLGTKSKFRKRKKISYLLVYELHKTWSYAFSRRSRAVTEKQCSNSTEKYDTRDDSQRRFLGQHSVATLFRTVTTLFQHCNTVLSKKSSLRIVPGNITLRLRSHGTRRIFDRLKKFDRTLGSHGTVQYFCSVHTELWTSKRLNVRLVKVGPCERNTLTREFSTGREFVRCYVNVA